MTENYEKLKKALLYKRKAAEIVDQEAQDAAEDPSLNIAARQHWLTVCGLCRRQVTSPKAIAAGGETCLSCKMTKYRPTWVQMRGSELARWRLSAGLSREEMAALCGWHWSNQARLENSKSGRVGAKTARKLASALVALIGAGRDVSAAARDWPQFPLLVDQSLVERAAEGSAKFL